MLDIYEVKSILWVACVILAFMAGWKLSKAHSKGGEDVKNNKSDVRE